jgi:hypothetical protein
VAVEGVDIVDGGVPSVTRTVLDVERGGGGSVITTDRFGGKCEENLTEQAGKSQGQTDLPDGSRPTGFPDKTRERRKSRVRDVPGGKRREREGLLGRGETET